MPREQIASNPVQSSKSHILSFVALCLCWWSFLHLSSNDHLLVVQEKMSTHPAINRILVPGRLVVLSNNSQKYSFLGVVLDKIPNHGRRNSVNILVLCDKDGPCCYLDGDTDGDSDDAWPVRPHAIFVPESSCWQKLVSVQVRKISVISSRTIQIKAERILKDIWKREQHRFK